MFNFDDTTLICGAGASVPSGFPTGEGLITDLKDLALHASGKKNAEKPRDIFVEFSKIFQSDFIQKKNIHTAFGCQNRSSEVLIYFVKELTNSSFTTIDSFLTKTNYLRNELKEGLQEIGKILIACIIDYYEKIPTYETKQDWIEHLLNTCLDTKANIERFFNRPPKIITFNYDNKLEFLLYHRLIQVGGCTHSEALFRIESLEIFHIYGSTGSISNIDRLHQSNVYNKSLNIKVINDERNNEEYKKAIMKETHRRISTSLHVYFLGFGFDKINCSLLFGGFSLNDLEPFFYSTDFKMTPEEIERRDEILPIKLHNFGETPGTIDCIKLIKNLRPPFHFDKQVVSRLRWGDSKKPKRIEPTYHSHQSSTSWMS